MENDESDVQIATRVDRALYEKIVKRQEEAKKLTGLEPSISAIVRVMLAEAPEAKGKKR
jgi:hypothetical protein